MGYRGAWHSISPPPQDVCAGCGAVRIDDLIIMQNQGRRWQHYWENEIEGYGKVPILGGGKQPSVFKQYRIVTTTGTSPLT